jgi:histidyl-tRNA synthetase
MAGIIEPRVLKGFRDFLPTQESQRKGIETILVRTFESFGFVPIDTPIIEYTEVLLGKGGGDTDKQIYRFRDHGDRDVALRYDLTVPFARFMAAHAAELYTPFKRYHIAKVFRGENTQRGRYREFTQCDFDIVGADSASADFEILETLYRSFLALDVSGISIHLSHRGVLNQLLAGMEAGGRSAEILRIVDKLAKIGAAEVRSLLEQIVGAEHAGLILEFIQPEQDFESTLSKMVRLSGGESDGSRRLSEILLMVRELGIESSFVLDPSITRGLDYYTGIVYEAFLSELPDIGAVGAGGRYDNLASLYTKLELPGVGCSIGLDRLTAALEELGRVPAADPGVQVLVLRLDDDLVPYYHALAGRVRAAGFSCEVYPERKKLAAQFAFGDKKSARVAVICGENERAGGTVGIKDLATRQSYDGLTIEAAIEQIGRIL